MINHIFRMLWVQRGKYIGVFIVQSIVCIVFVVLFVSIFKKVEMYNTPGNMKTDNIVRVVFKFIPGMAWNTEQAKSAHLTMQSVMDDIAKLPNIKNICKAEYLAPYQISTDDYQYNTIKHNDRSIKYSLKIADQNSAFIYEPLITHGEWITDGRLSDGSWPAVITQSMADTLNLQHPLGKTIEAINEYAKLPIPLTIVGVVSGVKEHLFEESPLSIIVSPEHQASINPWPFRGEYNIEINGDFDILATTFNKEFNKRTQNEFTQDKNVYTSVLNIDKYRKSEIINNTMTEFFMAIPSLFFLIFTFIGTYGLFWLYSQKRIREFALRRAIGSSKNRILILLVGESVVLTTMAAIPAVVMSLVVYSFEINTIYAILLTLAIMVVFSLFSALSPAVKVSNLPIYEVIKSE